jgi:hypothetical protein
MAPWTADCANTVQYTASEALAGTARIMYVGSMYLSEKSCVVLAHAP